jgi:alpha-mannosidase
VLRHPRYTRDRIAQVGERIAALVHADARPPDRLEVAGPVGRIRPAEAEALTYRACALGERFGPLWATYWVRVGARVPPEWDGRRVDLVWVSHGEATLWAGGRCVQGLNAGPGGDRISAAVASPARAGEELDLRVEVACNGAFGRPERPFASLEPFVLDRCELAAFDAEAWDLHHDFDVLRRLEADAAAGLDESWAGLLLAELNRVCNVWVEDDRATWQEARGILRTLLEHRNGTRTHRVTAIGHGHLDTAWLWPIAETRRKALRTFSSQVAIMDRYPEHRFACSQACQYDWVRESEPGLYDRIRSHAEAGRWVPVGGTWVEPDCNLPSGESLVRQFLHGQRFFEREFGRRCAEFWNPDVFGYNGQLPQIMRGAGIGRFLTQKLSWNRFNPPPHHTFRWQGIDGSEVLAHFPPADTYNAGTGVEELRRSARAFKDHDRSGHSLLVFGHGDGGGGPTPEMLESLRRAGDLQGVPRTALGTPDEFFAAVEAEAEATELPAIAGELYFEYHRGTYTSQAAVKRGNRAGERALHDADLLAAVAARVFGREHPTARLGELWRTLLVNQFHDILPGSSIAEVYEDAARDHAQVLAGAAELTEAALAALSGGRSAEAGAGAVPVNTLGVARAEVAAGPDDDVVWAAAPSCGTGSVGEAPDTVAVERSGDRIVLANGRLRAELGQDGTVRSLVEAATGREALAGPGNVLQVYDDRPTAFDAWDVDPFHLETARDCPPAESCRVALEEPLRAEVVFERRVGRASRMRQTVRLDAGSPRLEFRCEVDWRERHTMLKALFPVAVHAADATYQMQFGCVERPTHYSTSHDLARYEVPGHRFADMSEQGFGVALLTDSTYGYSTFGREMRLSLLRSPAEPDPGADTGLHEFAYAVMPHAGGWREAGVVAEAARFETPLRWAAAEPGRSFFSVDDPNLVLDTVKPAEDSEAIVVRLYEAHGARGTARLRVGVPFSGARRCTLLEDAGDDLPVSGDEVELTYRPHEILTVLLG